MVWIKLKIKYRDNKDTMEGKYCNIVRDKLQWTLQIF